MFKSCQNSNLIIDSESIIAIARCWRQSWPHSRRGFSQLSVSFKNLEVICSARLGSAWPEQETLSPSFSQHRQQQQHTPQLRRIPGQRGGGRWLLDVAAGKRHLSSVPRDHSVSVASLGHPTLYNCILLFKVLWSQRAVSCGAACTSQQHGAQSLSLT